MGTIRMGHTDAMDEPSTATQPVILRVATGPDRGREVRLERGTLSIGSSPDAELVLAEATVSRHHAELALVPQGLRVKDLGSTNGTFVAGSRVVLAVVQPGATIRVGRVSIEILAVDSPAPVLPADVARFGDLVGDSLSMRRAFALLDRAASTSTPVWIHGEPGTGKTSAARAIHSVSRLADRPLRTLDLGSSPTHEEMHATFDASSSGVLLLERADESSAVTQNLLLGILGAIDTQPTRPRFVTTSTLDPRHAVERGMLRRDVFFHLGAARVELPPLREHLEDLPRLVEAIASALGHQGVRTSDAELGMLRGQSFPGNVRELRRIIEEVLLRRAPRASEAALPSIDDSVIERLPFKDAKEKLLDAFERHYIEQLLDRADGNLTKAAKIAGLDRNHLTRLAIKHGLRGERDP